MSSAHGAVPGAGAPRGPSFRDAGCPPPEGAIDIALERGLADIRRPLHDIGLGSASSPRLVVDIWLANRVADEWAVLMLRRRPERGGFWQGVSGRVERRDASLEAAARREIHEELGLADGVEVFDLGRWIDFVGPVSGTNFRKRSLGAVIPAVSIDSLALSEEHDLARLVTFDEARALVRWPENIEELSAFAEVLASGRRPPL